MNHINSQVAEQVKLCKTPLDFSFMMCSFSGNKDAVLKGKVIQIILIIKIKV